VFYLSVNVEGTWGLSPQSTESQAKSLESSKNVIIEKLGKLKKTKS